MPELELLPNLQDHSFASGRDLHDATQYCRDPSALQEQPRSPPLKIVIEAKDWAYERGSKLNSRTEKQQHRLGTEQSWAHG